VDNVMTNGTVDVDFNEPFVADMPQGHLDRRTMHGVHRLEHHVARHTENASSAQ